MILFCNYFKREKNSYVYGILGYILNKVKKNEIFSYCSVCSNVSVPNARSLLSCLRYRINHVLFFSACQLQFCLNLTKRLLHDASTPSFNRPTMSPPSFHSALLNKPLVLSKLIIVGFYHVFFLRHY